MEKVPYTKPTLNKHKIEMGVHGNYNISPGARDGRGGHRDGHGGLGGQGGPDQRDGSL
jgi:hypothetical protein